MSSARDLFEKLPDTVRVPPVATAKPVVEPGGQAVPVQSARDLFNSLPDEGNESDESAGPSLEAGGRTIISKPGEEPVVKTWGNQTAQAEAQKAKTGRVEAIGRGIHAAIPFQEQIEAAIQPGDFAENLKERRAQEERIKQEHPGLYYGSMATGSLALPGGAAAGAEKTAATQGLSRAQLVKNFLLRRLQEGKAALPAGITYGALQGATGSKGWETGEVGQVAKDTAIGAGVGGGAAGVLAPVMGAGGELLQKGADAAGRLANSQAVRAVTNKYGELLRMLGREGIKPGADTDAAIQRLGQTIRDKDILPLLGGRAEAARRAGAQFNQVAGDIGRAREAVTSANRMNPQEFGINTQPITEGIKSEVLPKYVTDLAVSERGDPDIALKYMAERLSPNKDVQAVSGPDALIAPSDLINRLRGLENNKGLFQLGGAKTPTTAALEQATGLARGQLKAQMVDNLRRMEGQNLVPPGTADKYASGMLDFGTLKALSKTFNQQTAADQTRRMISPSSYLTGLAGIGATGVGAEIGNLEGGHVKSGALGGMLLHQLLLHRGNAAAANLTGATQRALQSIGGLTKAAGAVAGKVGGSMTRPIEGITNTREDPRRP